MAVFPISGSPAGGGAAPTPEYSGRFIPTLWSGKLIEKFYDATVLAAIANTDYEGDISKYGDKVVIRTKPTITIRDYQAYGALTLERPSSNVVELLIDKGKYFYTVLDDVMEVQSDINHLDMWADDASQQMKIKIDQDVLPGMVPDVSADNVGDTAGRLSNNVNLGTAAAPLKVWATYDDVGAALTATDVEVIELIVRLGQVLDEQNIPETGRWLIIPSWLAAHVKRSELRDASLSGDGTSMLRNGRLGMIDRFTLYGSNLLPTAPFAGPPATTMWTVMAGSKHGLTFASQMTKMETLRLESTFGTGLRGLQVYGYQVVDGTALAVAQVIQGLRA